MPFSPAAGKQKSRQSLTVCLEPRHGRARVSDHGRSRQEVSKTEDNHLESRMARAAWTLFPFQSSADSGRAEAGVQRLHAWSPGPILAAAKVRYYLIFLKMLMLTL